MYRGVPTIFKKIKFRVRPVIDVVAPTIEKLVKRLICARRFIFLIRPMLESQLALLLQEKKVIFRYDEILWILVPVYTDII